jgi:DNA primase
MTDAAASGFDAVYVTVRKVRVHQSEAATGKPFVHYWLHPEFLIVEGEKACEAARKLFPNNPVLSWPNGAAAVKSTDWTPLTGRKVIVWPDNDAPGKAALNEIATIIGPIVDGPVRYVDVGHQKPGFDAADLGNMQPTDAMEWLKPKIKIWEEPKQQTTKAKEQELLASISKPDSLKRKLKAEIKDLEEKVKDWEKQIDEAKNMVENVLPKEARDYRANPDWLKIEK